LIPEFTHEPACIAIEPAVLAVIIPVFNEVRWIDTIVQQVLHRTEVGQVIVVDDGSEDGSWEKIQRWSHLDKRVAVMRHTKNIGKGAAIRTGIHLVTSPMVLIQDADLEYSPDDYPKLLSPMVSKAAQVVYGSRFLDPKKSNPSWHTLGNRTLTCASNLLTGLRLTDEATCYKLFKTEILKGLSLQENRFGFCPEITAKIARRGISITEVSISYHGRNRIEGKKIRLIDGFSALYCLWKYS